MRQILSAAGYMLLLIVSTINGCLLVVFAMMAWAVLANEAARESFLSAPGNYIAWGPRGQYSEALPALGALAGFCFGFVLLCVLSSKWPTKSTHSADARTDASQDRFEPDDAMEEEMVADDATA